MTDDMGECLDDRRDLRAAVQMNRVGHLLHGGEEMEDPMPRSWKVAPQRDRPGFFHSDIVRVEGGAQTTAWYADPVVAGFVVLGGPSEEVRRRSEMARRFAEYDERIARLEAALAEREQARARVNPVLQNALERLREKAKHVPLPPPEEVWESINLLAPDEEED
ncbi:MAG TPA: hypothetical protein VFQ76_06590 [Longimicrobiaceae bacterium]|nr:hypothetical protein [Longimicrobiaceae bacterium]